MSAKIATALNEVMAKVGYVQKTGKNEFHGYRYAGEAALLAVLRPAMVEAGLILIPSMTNAEPPDSHGTTLVRMEYTLVHKDGDMWPEKIVFYGAGNDRARNGNIGDKGVYKAITGANKYALFKLFQIETGDDPEKDHPGEQYDPQDRQEAAPPPRSNARNSRAAQRSLEKAGNPVDRPQEDAFGLQPLPPHDPETGEVEVHREPQPLSEAESRAMADAMIDKLEKLAKDPKRSTLGVWARANKPMTEILQPHHRDEVKKLVDTIKAAIKIGEQQAAATAAVNSSDRGDYDRGDGR